MTKEKVIVNLSEWWEQKVRVKKAILREFGDSYNGTIIEEALLLPCGEAFLVQREQVEPFERIAEKEGIRKRAVYNPDYEAWEIRPR